MFIHTKYLPKRGTPNFTLQSSLLTIHDKFVIIFHYTGGLKTTASSILSPAAKSVLTKLFNQIEFQQIIEEFLGQSREKKDGSGS